MSITFQVSDGDIFVDEAGRFIEIGDEQKLGQDIAESLMSNLDPVRDYGSELNTLTSPTPIAGVATNSQAFVAQLVIEAVTRLQALENNSPNSSTTETIASINTINVVISPDDPSTAYFYLVVTNVAGTQVTSLMQLTSLNQQMLAGASLQFQQQLAQYQQGKTFVP